MTSSKNFYLEHISLMIIHDHSRYHGGAIDCGVWGEIINTNNYYTMATPYQI